MRSGQTSQAGTYDDNVHGLVYIGQCRRKRWLGECNNSIDFEQPRWYCKLWHRDKSDCWSVTSQEALDMACMLSVGGVIVHNEKIQFHNVLNRRSCGNDNLA